MEPKWCKSCRFLNCRFLGKAEVWQNFVFHVDVHRDDVGESFVETFYKTVRLWVVHHGLAVGGVTQ